MVEIFGKNYYINLDNIIENCKTSSPEEASDEQDESSVQINIFKYEILKMCLETVLDGLEDADEKLSSYAQENLSVSFKLAFNTLIKNNIIVEDDE